MALSATGSPVNVGNSGKLRVLVDVRSQWPVSNTSIVRVRGQMAKRNNIRSNNNNGVPMSVGASPGGGTASESNPFDIAGDAWQTVIDRDITVNHAADGTRTITASFTLGASGTSAFGNGGTATVKLAIKRIPRAPSKPSKPSISNVTSSSFRVSLSSAPASNGASITEYRWEIENLTDPSSATATTSGRVWDTDGRGANTQYRVRVQARNSAGWGPLSDWVHVTTKVREPSAPTNVQATRVNDGRANITWTLHASTVAPVTSQRVQRSRWDGSARAPWVNVATVSGGATSFVDTSISANNDYRYRVQAINASGTGTSADSNRVRTTPAAPTGVSAKKRGADIVVAFARSTPWVGDSHHEVQDNPGGAGWVTVGTTSNEGEFVHADVNPAVSHQYRVRTVDTLTGTLNGVWSGLSNVVQLLAAPLAPSLVGPNGAVDRDEPVRLEYAHNPVDTTDQTAGEIRWRPTGGAWTTVNTGADSFYDLPAPGASETIEWQARTKGEHADWSPWSPVWSFPAVSRPEVVIQSPEGTADQSQVEVVWGYQNADSSGQSRWEAQLLDAEDNILATGSGSDTADRYMFPTVLDDATTYTVQVRARAGTGLWSQWDTSTFTTDFPLPYPIEVLPEWDRGTGAVSITFQIDDSDATEQVPDSLDVQRDDGDGWITIAVDLDPETSIVDHTPRLAEVRYRTISRTVLPTARTGPETVIEWVHGSADPIYVNGGTGFEAVCTAVGHEVTDSPDIEQALQEWAGWAKPTAVFGTGENYAIQFRGKIFPGIPHLGGRSTREEWHELLLRRGIVCYRDCQGRKIFGLLGISFQSGSGVTDFNLTVSETHHVEGVQAVLPVPEAVN